MENTPQYRLKLFIDERFNGSTTEFAKAIGKTYDYVRHYIKKDGSVFGSKIHPLLRDLSLNVDWYLRGEGAMLSIENCPEKLAASEQDNEQLRKTIIELNAQIDVLKSLITKP